MTANRTLAVHLWRPFEQVEVATATLPDCLMRRKRHVTSPAHAPSLSITAGKSSRVFDLGEQALAVGAQTPTKLNEASD